MQPGIGVAGSVAKRVAGRRAVLLECLAHLEVAREIGREFLEASFIQRRLAIGQIAADRCDRNAEPVVAVLAGGGGSVGPSAVFLAEIVGNVVHLKNFGREQLRQRMQSPRQIEAGAGVCGDGCLRLHVFEGFAEHVHLGAGRRLECRDHGVESVVFRRNEALPSHHGELRALFCLPWRRLCPGFGPIEQSRAAERAGRGNRRASLHRECGE